jgi:sulfate permease, SulP family
VAGVPPDTRETTREAGDGDTRDARRRDGRRSLASSLVPAWMRGYRRAWVRPDVVAGIVIWSVIVPQAVAYAQIAGLPPEAGLIAAPGALLGYALLGASRTLVVSATTATSALSAAAIAPLADGDTARFAALSAGLAIVAAATLAAAGVLRLGAISDFVSKPVMTGFLFGLGLTIMLGQVPKLLGIPGASGSFVEQIGPIVRHLGDTDALTAVVGAASIAALVLLRRFAPAVPGILVVLVASIAISALFGLSDHGVDVVGALPSAVPDPSVPDISWDDALALLPAALGVMLVSTEAVGVARTLAAADGYTVRPSRELVALGGANLLAGLSSGFVQSGGASQTAAAERAGGKTQAASVVAAALVLVTGAFLAPLFKDLPQATLGAIVVVAVSGFLRADELRRFARIRRSAIALALIALVGMLVLGVLPGLILAAAVSLVLVLRLLSRPPVGILGRDPVTGVWGWVDRNPTFETVPGVTAIRSDAPLFYPNAVAVKEQMLAAARRDAARVVVVDLSNTADLDIETIDALSDLEQTLGREGIELRLAGVRRPALARLRRSGLADRVRVERSLGAAIGEEEDAAAAPTAEE